MKKYIPFNFNEAKQVGILYHFTSISNLEQIVISNYILKSGTYIRLNNKRIPVISFTRDYNLNNTYLINTECRIAVNGDKLSNKYKIIPYSDYINDYKKEKEEILLSKEANIKNSIIQIDILNTEEYFKTFYNQKYDLFNKQFIKFNFVEKYNIIK